MLGESTKKAALQTLVICIPGASKHWIAEFLELCSFGLLFEFRGCPSSHIGSSMHMWRLAPLLLALSKLPHTAAVSSWMARLYGTWPWVFISIYIWFVYCWFYMQFPLYVIDYSWVVSGSCFAPQLDCKKYCCP